LIGALRVIVVLLTLANVECDSNVIEEEWIHIGACNQQSWSASVFRLVRDTDVIAVNTAEANNSIALRAAPTGMVVGACPVETLGLDAIPRCWNDTNLERECGWAVHLFNNDAERTLETFVPAQIEVLRSTKLNMFWPGAVRARELKALANARVRKGPPASASKPSPIGGGPDVLDIDWALIPVGDDPDPQPDDGGGCGGGIDLADDVDIEVDPAEDWIDKVFEDVDDSEHPRP
jgi:hypothetical protein